MIIVMEMSNIVLIKMTMQLHWEGGKDVPV